jgi:hypothetical protein
MWHAVEEQEQEEEKEEQDGYTRMQWHGVEALLVLCNMLVPPFHQHC